MATIRISQLTAVTAPTDDDVLIINDADTNTRKITFANLTQGLLNTSATPQVKAGNLTVSGTLTANGGFVVDTDTLFVDVANDRVGINTTTPATSLDVDGNIHIRNQNELQLGDSNNSNYVGLKAPSAITSNFALTLPSALPATGNFITYDTAGLGSFATETGFISNELRAPYIGARGVGGNSGEVRLYELITNGGEYIALQAPGNLASTIYYTLPGTYPGSNGFVLSSTTTGTLSWVSNASAAAGSAGYLQFNTGGSLDANAGLTWDTPTTTLTAANISVTTNLDVDGSTVLGDNAAVDTLDINATIVSDLLPTTGTYDLGGPSNQWQELHVTNVYTGAGEIVQNGVARSDVHFDGTVASAATLDCNLGSQTAYYGYKLLVHARDTVTGDVEMYEHLIVQDGSGGISEIVGSNVQAPLPGVFLSTPTTAVDGFGDIVCSIANTAVAGNNLSITVQATSLTSI